MRIEDDMEEKCRQGLKSIVSENCRGKMNVQILFLSHHFNRTLSIL